MFGLRRNNKQQNTTQAQRYRYEADEHEARQPIAWRRGFLLLGKICLVGLIIAGLLWWLLTFRQYKAQPISKVQVVATYEHISPTVLQNIISSYASGDVFAFNAIALKQKLLTLPWVERVFIKRKWPNMITVGIIEQNPIAQWNNEALLNSQGMLFTPLLATFPHDLPLLSGDEANVQDIVDHYSKMQKLLQPLALKIMRLSVDDQGVWVLSARDTDNHDITLFLGSEDILPRFENFIFAYPKIKAENPNKVIESVDLHYKDGLAVRWEGGKS